jgi:hypothetical protein
MIGRSQFGHPAQRQPARRARVLDEALDRALPLALRAGRLGQAHLVAQQDRSAPRRVSLRTISHCSPSPPM